MSINTTLGLLGLTGSEVKLYLALQKHGKALPSALARITKINRATVYSLASSLQSKGLIAEDAGGKSRYLVPLPPASLQNLIEGPKRELKEKESHVAEAITELQQLVGGKAYPIPKIRFVQEDDLEQFLFDNTRKWQVDLLAQDGIWWGFQDSSVVEHYEKWIKHTLTTPESRDPRYKGQVMTSASSAEARLAGKIDAVRRQVRQLAGVDFSASIWVGGDYIVMITTAQHPFYLVEIHDHALAHNMREMLKKIWNEAKD